METHVGEFTFDPQAEQVSGPAQYMQEQGSELLKAISSGTDTVFNMSAGYSPDIITAILVRMQTDYAGWHGMATFNAMRERSA